jgi:hypothetical protein
MLVPYFAKIQSMNLENIAEASQFKWNQILFGGFYVMSLNLKKIKYIFQIVLCFKNFVQQYLFHTLHYNIWNLGGNCIVKCGKGLVKFWNVAQNCISAVPGRICKKIWNIHKNI